MYGLPLTHIFPYLLPSFLTSVSSSFLLFFARIQLKTRKGWTPFLAAVEQGQIEAVILLLKRHANEHVILPDEEGGGGGLIIAAKKGYKEVVGLLLENGK